MITDKFVKGYAVLKSEWLNKDILDEYIPFIATIIIDNKITEVDEIILTKLLNEKYQNIFQENFVRQILSQAVKKGAIIYNRGRFTVDEKEMSKYVIKMESFDYDFDLLVDEFIAYANGRKYYPSKEEVRRLIFDFVDKYDDRVLYNNISDLDINNNAFLYHWCNYVIEIKEKNKKLSEFFIGICFGNLVKNALFYASNSKSEFSNLVIYLDTPMIFALMGMDTPERETSYNTLLTKATNIGMTIRVFDHNFEEAKGIMERASRWALSGKYDAAKANKVAQFFYESTMSHDEIIEFIHDFQRKLNSKGISIENTDYVAEENTFQADEEKLFQDIKNEYGCRSLKYNSEAEYDNSIRTDVRSLVMIQRKRAGVYSTDLNNARCIFITTNGVVAKVSKDYTLEDELTKDKIPTAVTADLFGTLLWMNYPDKNEYIEQKLIADCKALLKASPQMIARFNIELDNAYQKKDNGLTEEKFLFLRSHPIVQKFLLDATSGDYSQFDTNTWRSVYDRIVSSAEYNGEKKYVEEKSLHDITKGELERAKDLIKEKDEIEKSLNATIIQQQEKISSALSKIITAILFAAPYLTISIVIILIQNELVNWTIKGILLAIVTVVLGVLMRLLYNFVGTHLKNCLKKGIGKWLNKTDK